MTDVATTVDTIDLSQRWNNGNTKLWKHILKNTTASKPGPPSLNDGAIFSNGSSLWLYGGVRTSLRVGPPTPIPPNGIWRYDIAAGQWSQPFAGGDPVQRLFRGSFTQAGSSTAFYLGGAKSPLSDAVFNGQSGATPYLVQGLLVFDENKQSFSNVSTTGLNLHGTVKEGFLTCIEALGTQGTLNQPPSSREAGSALDLLTFVTSGVLVAFGGYTSTPAKSTSLPPADADIDNDGLEWPMENITVYDIASQHWYNQQATGDVPSWRHHGCSVVVSAADHSSHSLYVFGGWGSLAANGRGDDVYVLSIPSFRWIRVTSDGTQRYRHRCHLMGKNHMLVVGGIKPISTGGPGLAAPIDLAEGITNCDNDPKFSQGLGIFSLNNHTWTTEYDPVIGAAPYQVHPSISKVIGGNTTGGATKLFPDNGFSSDALRDLLGFARQESAGTAPSPPANSTLGPKLPSPPPPSRQSLGTGAIAGIAVSLAICTVFALGLTWFLRDRRRRHHQNTPPESKANQINTSISQPIIPIEADAGPAAPEFSSGNAEESLARMHQSHEMSDASARYEMPPSSGNWGRPSLYETHEIPGFLEIPELPDLTQAQHSRR
ncbi:MAG: hypothetical protein Q9184_002652 [Pyrenodesmia sp. 2 TL-2023]